MCDEFQEILKAPRDSEITVLFVPRHVSFLFRCASRQS